MAEPLSGILLVNKPRGWSSHDVVAKLRVILGQKKIGHTGTLDPQADGLLAICLGRATKIARLLSGCDKTYHARCRLGIESPTYDSEGVDPDIIGGDVTDLTADYLETHLAGFRGELDQTVPPFSAVQVDGERLYSRARRGERTDLPVRRVLIRELTMIDFRLPYVDLKVTCSAGTYIRSLAHDLGRSLGCGAYLDSLTRTASGDLTLDHALTLTEITHLHESGDLAKQVLALDDVLHLPAVIVTDDFADKVATGLRLDAADVVDVQGDFAQRDEVLLKNRRGRVLAFGRALMSSPSFQRAGMADLLKYERVLN